MARKPCKTCGGSGHIGQTPHEPECQKLQDQGALVSCDCIQNIPCPDCGGTGNRGRTVH